MTYYDSETGKRWETSTTFATEREAKKWSREQEMAYREDPNRKPPSEETVAQFISYWLRIKKTMNIATETYRGYEQRTVHIVRGLGTKPLKNLTTMDIQPFYAGLSEQYQLSSRTINFTHAVLNMALNDAVEWGLVSRNPAQKATARRGSRKKAIRVPSPEEMATLLAHSRETRWYALWFWFAETGTRLGEALAVQWSDIDWEKREVNIHQAISGDAARRTVKSPKSARGHRTITVGVGLINALKAHRTEQEAWKQMAGDKWQDTGFVFTTYEGKMLSKRYINRVFKRAMAEAGLSEDIRVHDMRHGMATQWLSAGVNPKVVSERLGHSNVAFTLDVYGHVLPHEESKIVGPMEDALLTGPSTRHPHELRKVVLCDDTVETPETP